MTTLAPTTKTRTTFVYAFDEPDPGGRELLGGKGLGLSEMAHLGVPVPAGFTITTDACRTYLAGDGGWLEVLELTDDTLQIRYEGACGSCPSSLTGTLMAIENMIREEIDPAISVVAT